MKIYIYVFLLVVFCIIACDKEEEKTTHIVTFEELELDTNSYWFGEDSSGGFVSRNVYFNNYFEVSLYGEIWAGFAYSNKTDNTTPGLLNQYSAYTGKGTRSSSNYGVANINEFYGIYPEILFLDSVKGVEPVSIMVTNNTYTALSMKEGDEYAKKFGGDTGDDPDWFKLIIEGIGVDDESTGTVELYLADYTFPENERDYIISEWEQVNLLPLGVVKALKFSLSSSDVGQFGMNTPAYFCIDDLYFLIDN